MSTTAEREPRVAPRLAGGPRPARVARLAYAPEIAEAMLRRRQASAMLSNLMVVLTSDRAPTPVINAGSLY